ncbi:efflux pump antibiotic resistance protein [Rutstroemia sp. NJR-2017a BBW]|nr:efflux pump antibiotic resistance protein [Rutstroemia sp. NJR-2017a BBW]
MVGAGLLTTIDARTPTVRWSAYMVINGLGTGIAQQLPYTALQVVLSEEDVPTGNAIAVFVYQIGAAISVSIAQNLFLTKLKTSVPTHTSAVSPADVIEVGATGLQSLARSSSTVLVALRDAYADAIQDTMYYALATACVALPFACGMQWLNIKKVAEERREAKLQLNGLGVVASNDVPGTEKTEGA